MHSKVRRLCQVVVQDERRQYDGACERWHRGYSGGDVGNGREATCCGYLPECVSMSRANPRDIGARGVARFLSHPKLTAAAREEKWLVALEREGLTLLTDKADGVVREPPAPGTLHGTYSRGVDAWNGWT